MTYFPNEPRGAWLDYAYCGSPNCQNKCGRKMSESIQKELEKLQHARVTFAEFCGDDGEQRFEG